MNKSRIQGAAISAGIALLTGFLSSMLSGGGQMTTYQTITQPPYAPPGWLFGVVWPVLYILMGIAAYLVYSTCAKQEDKRKALLTYGLQLFVNFSWSIIFFRFQEYGIAAVVLALLLFLVTLTITFFYHVNTTAALLLIPYYLWLLFAYYLNIGVALLNPAVG